MLSVDGVKPTRVLCWDFALTSRMNEAYYQRKIKLWKTSDIITRSIAGLAASAAVGTLIASEPWASAALSALAAVASLVGGLLGIPERVRAFGVLLSEYTAHAQVFERLFQFDCADDEFRIALSKFEETEQRESKDDPTPDEKLLETCRQRVLKGIQSAAA